MKNKYDGVISQCWILWLALSLNRWLKLLPNWSVQEWGPNLNDTGSSNEILSKKYLESQLSGTRQPARLCRLHPPRRSPEQPALSSLLSYSEQEVRPGTPQGPLQPESYDPSSILVFRTHSTPAFQPHSTITRTAEVLKTLLLSLTSNSHVLTPSLVLYTNLSNSWDVTYKISQVGNAAKLTLLWTGTPIIWWKSRGLRNMLLAFTCGCFLWTLVHLLPSQLTLLQAMECYRGSEMPL